MDDNPYRSPLALDRGWDVDSEPASSRPLSLVILSIFQILLGLSSLRQFFVVGAGSWDIQLLPSLASMLIHGVVSTVAGIGMWAGIRWGWWLAALHSVYLIVRDTSALANLAAFGTGNRRPEDLVATAFVQFLLLLWLLSPSVLEYVSLKQLNKATAMAILTALSVAVIAFDTAMEDLAR